MTDTEELLGRFWEPMENKKEYIRGYGEGVGVPSRNWLLSTINDGETLLDVGCGPGCTFESIMENRRDIRYKGLDFCQGFIDACRELFPIAEFELGDANSLNEPDNSWDTVLLRHVLEHTEHYHDPIAEAFRVAQKRVVVVMWRPLSNGDDDIHVFRDGSNDYGRAGFLAYLNSFLRPVENHIFEGRRMNWAWVIHKELPECVFDLDDYHDEAPGIEELFSLKRQYPLLKATLFVIPARSSRTHLQDLANTGWIELVVHGWNHEPNTECVTWTYEQTHGILEMLEGWGVFSRGFRPPGWQLNEAVLDVLAEREYWIAPHEQHRRLVSQRGMQAFYAHNDFRSVHGHMQDISHRDPGQRNGIAQLINERGLPFGDETQFKFVSEAVK